MFGAISFHAGQGHSSRQDDFVGRFRWGSLSLLTQDWAPLAGASPPIGCGVSTPPQHLGRVPSPAPLAQQTLSPPQHSHRVSALPYCDAETAEYE